MVTLTTAKESDFFLNKLKEREVEQPQSLLKNLYKLSRFEHRLLDFCYLIAAEDSFESNNYKFKFPDVISFYELSNSGVVYRDIKKSLESLVLYDLLGSYKISENNEVQFEFPKHTVFDLRMSKTFSSKPHELHRLIKSTNSLILYKLWKDSDGSNPFIISNTPEKWQKLFLGSNKTMNTKDFSNKILKKSGKDLEEFFSLKVDITAIKSGRKNIAYTITIVDESQ